MAARKRIYIITWVEALDLFETRLRAKGAAELTVDEYVRAVRNLADRPQPFRPDQVKPADLREVQAGLLTGKASRSGRPLGASAVGRHVAAWRQGPRFRRAGCASGFSPTKKRNRWRARVCNSPRVFPSPSAFVWKLIFTTSCWRPRR